MNKKIYAHLSLLGAACAWGLMSPIGKIAMEDAVSGLAMAYFRMLGGAICFWLASFLAPKERVNAHDLKLLFFAEMRCSIQAVSDMLMLKIRFLLMKKLYMNGAVSQKH